MLSRVPFPRLASHQHTHDPRPEEARAFLSARRLEGRRHAILPRLILRDGHGQQSCAWPPQDEAFALWIGGVERRTKAAFQMLVIHRLAEVANGAIVERAGAADLVRVC